MRLQGYGADARGNILVNQIGDIRVGSRTSPPQVTGSIDLALNLNPNEEVSAVPWDPADPTASSSYSTSVTIYDSLGNPIQAEIYYRKVGANEWEYHMVVDGSQIDGGTPGELEEITSGSLEFDTEGNLVDHTQGAVAFDPAGATPNQALVLSFDGSTQYAGDYNLQRLRQDGFAAGDLRGISIQRDGTIVGLFSNGEPLSIGQVVLAQFDSPNGLQREGGNLWTRTLESGDPRVDPPGVGGRGQIAAGALESSNVDMAYEFVKMIATQRGYQANSKTISTADQMLQEVMNIKR
jgi:flagellar hook protein FlgE